MTIRKNVNTIYSGIVSGTMSPLPVSASRDFMVAASTSSTSDLTAVIISGMRGNERVSEQLIIPPGDVVYGRMLFSDVTSLTSKSYHEGTGLVLSAVDEAYQPVFWQAQYGPYGCVFSTNDGMSAGLSHGETGLMSNPGHYVRVPYRAPVSRDMEFVVSPGYEGQIFVPITDFDIVRMPPTSKPVEWAFRASRKEEN